MNASKHVSALAKRASLPPLALASLVLASLALALSPPHVLDVALAQGASSKTAAMRMAFVDMQQAILQTEEGKIARAKIEKEAESKKKDLVTQQAELKKLDDDFQAQQGVLSETDKAKKSQEFQTKLQSLRSAEVNFQQEVRQKEMDETQKIFKNLAAIIDEVGKKKGYDMVFERGSGALLYAAKIDDITTEVVQAYNIRHKVSKK